MSTTIAGLFDDLTEAREAVRELVDHGFPRDNISLMTNDQSEQRKAVELDDEQASQRVSGGFVSIPSGEGGDAEATAKGASVGAALGGVAGLLVGLGALTIPGIGPVIAAGPLIAALSGAGMGAVAGGLVTVLSRAGIPDADARLYAEGIRRGGTMLLVDVPEDQADLASDILNRHHPVDLEQRAGEWKEQKWSGNKEGSESFLFDHSQKPNKLRESRSELDYGPGANAFLPGKAVDEYDRSQADMSNYQNRRDDDWLTFQSRYAEHFKTNYAGTDKRWEDYRDAYHFGHNMGKDPRFSNQIYVNIEDAIQHIWKMDYPDRPWADYHEAVHAGWEGGHVPS